MITRAAIPLAIALLLIVFLAVGLQRDPQEVPSPFIGKQAPAFTLPTLADAQQTISSTQLQGNAYLLNVWGSWCPACRDEHEFLVTLAAREVVPIIGLNWKDTRADAHRWLTALGNPYTTVAFDPVGDVAIDWGVYGAPETFLVSAEGVVLHKHVGALTEQIWQEDFVSRWQAYRSEP